MPTRRRGYTLFELIVILAILIILAVILIPSVSSFRGDTRQRAAADIIRGELAIARARAKEEGRPYRISINDDGTRIRRAPDAVDFSTSTPSDYPSGSAAVVDYPFEQVTATFIPETDTSVLSDNGWVTVATVQPDGCCREDTALIVLKDGDQSPLYLRVRGLTTSARVVPPRTG